MGEAWSGEAHDLPGTFVADHVEVVLQRGVLGALEVHQLGGLIDPDLCRREGSGTGRDRLCSCASPEHTEHGRAAQGRG